MLPIKYRVVSLVLLFSSFLFFISCGDDDLKEQKGAVTFSFSVKSQDGARVTDDIDLEKVVLAVEEDDGAIVLDDKELSLNFINDSYLTEPISLSVGSYAITKFVVVGADGVVSYATPMEDSELAYLVEDPLPIDFEVSLDEVTQVVPEVISTKEGTVEDFGYADLAFEIVETFDVLLGAFVYSEAQAGHELTEASLLVYGDGDSLTSQELFAATNKITLPDRFEEFKLIVEKEGYITFNYSYSADSIKNYQGNNANGPLEIVLVSEELNEGLIAYYPLDGNANDESGNGNDGTVVGASLSEDRDGNESSAYNFDADEDYIDLRERTIFDLDQYESYSFSVWIKPATTDSGTVISKYISASNNRMWWLQIREGNIGYGVGDNGLGGEENVDRIEAPIEKDVWQHIVLTFDGLEYKLFVNGELNNTLIKTKDMLDNSPTAKTLIGGIHFSKNLFDRLYTGSIDEVRIYNRVLSNTEIDALFND